MISSHVLFFVLMIAGTFFLGVDDVLKRKYIHEGFDEQLLLGVSWFGGGLLLYIPLLIFGFPELRSGFWSAFFTTVALNIISQNIFVRAFKFADASLIAPLRLLTPPFVILTGFLVLGELPNFWGIFGIFTTIIGLWLLVVHKENGIHGNAKTWKGIMFGTIGSILFALSFPYDKKAVVASSGLFLAATIFVVVGSIMLIGSFIFRPSSRKVFSKGFMQRPIGFLLTAFTSGVGQFLTAQALVYSLAVYAASLKRLWSLWTVILAGQFLEERDLKRRLIATLIMLSGVAITAIWG